MPSNGKLSLNFSNIEKLDATDLPLQSLNQIRGVKKLFLSHNSLVTLKGIEAFDQLTHLSVASNYIQSIEEFTHIKNPQ